MKTSNAYIIGEMYSPEWCRRFISHYKKLDGTTGYVFHGKMKDYDLNAGDELIKTKVGKITVKRKGE